MTSAGQQTILARMADRPTVLDPRAPGYYVMFDGPPGPVSGRFVEVENEAGQSVSIRKYGGAWRQEAPDLWALGPFAEARDPDVAKESPAVRHPGVAEAVELARAAAYPMRSIAESAAERNRKHLLVCAVCRRIEEDFQRARAKATRVAFVPGIHDRDEPNVEPVAGPIFDADAMQALYGNRLSDEAADRILAGIREKARFIPGRVVITDGEVLIADWTALVASSDELRRYAIDWAIDQLEALPRG